MSGFAEKEISFVVDDAPPWRARGVEVIGEVGPGFAGESVRISPGRIVGWGTDSEAHGPNARSVTR